MTFTIIVLALFFSLSICIWFGLHEISFVVYVVGVVVIFAISLYFSIQFIEVLGRWGAYA